MDNRQQANHSNQPHTAHETHDVPVKPIMWTLVGLGIFLLVVMTVFAFWFRAEEAKRVASESAVQQVEQIPTGVPRLQPQPAADLKTLRAHEREILTTYGWVDKDAGIARIPIDRAIDLALEQGYPVREGQ